MNSRSMTVAPVWITGPELMPVDQLGDRRATVPDELRDLLGRDTGVRQDRNERVPQFPRRPLRRIDPGHQAERSAKVPTHVAASMPVPSRVVKTNPESCHRRSAASSSAAHVASAEHRHRAGRARVRRDLRVLVSPSSRTDRLLVDEPVDRSLRRRQRGERAAVIEQLAAQSEVGSLDFPVVVGDPGWVSRWVIALCLQILSNNTSPPLPNRSVNCFPLSVRISCFDFG